LLLRRLGTTNGRTIGCGVEALVLEAGGDFEGILLLILPAIPGGL